jgi:sarcosine oxidase subunit beta
MMPDLPKVERMTASWGAPTYTADYRPLVGPVPGVQGLFAIAGCNEAGVTHAPGFGKVISELVLEGDARLTSIEPFRLDRFGESPPRPDEIVMGYLEARGHARGSETTATAASEA